MDAALVDIMMPDMDGYETMSRIRANPAIAGIPLIAVTAKAMKGDRQKCLDAGASDYISKPVDIDILLALIRVWLGRSKSQPEPARAKRPSTRVA
jgi:CheY-like chemotaxis protein